jgi:hypothetical protein
MSNNTNVLIQSIEELKNYKNLDYIYFKCKKCNKEVKILKVNLLRDPELRLMCAPCKRKESMMKKFGAETTFGRKDLKRWDLNTKKAIETKIKKYGSLKAAYNNITEKSKQTKLEKYGDENFNNRKKSVETCLKKYGVENPQQNEAIQEKTEQTRLEKYGVRFLAQNKDIMKKQLETKRKKYGDDYFEPIKKSQQTKLEKYGNSFYTNREKAKQTMLERYGAEYSLQSEELRKKSQETFENNFPEGSPQKQDIYDKMNQTKLKNHNGNYLDWEKYKKTMFEKYGYEHPGQIPEIHRKMVRHIGRTKPEKKLEEMLKSRSIQYQIEYYINKHHYDFAIFENDDLKLLVDIDGLYYHAVNSDADGHHSINSEKDFTRHYIDNIPVIVIDENKLEEGFKEILRVFNIDYDTWINEIFEYCSNMPFPYPKFDDKRLQSDYGKLCKYEFNNRQHLGESLIYNFHPSIWSHNLRNKPSPIEAWNNNELLLKCIKNRFIYASTLTSQQIARGFTINKIAPRISLFNPSYAKYLIQKYLNNYNTIFDPFSGFSGRLLGTYSLDKQYIGQDINNTTIEESNNLKNFLNLSAKLETKDLFNSKGKYECLFTCPPYNDKENWGQDIRNLTCDDWIEECLNRFKCNNYLFVVDKTEKFKNNIVETKSNKSHIGSNEELVLLL